VLAPALKAPAKARLTAELAGTDVRNSWDVWLFPKVRRRAPVVGQVAASPRVLAALADRYPGLVKLGTPAAAKARVVLTDSFRAEAWEALRRGKNVVLLKLPGPRPGVRLGWWGQGPQTGTAIARHPAFGKLPHEGYLDELFFRMLGGTVQCGAEGFQSVEPLMVGSGRLGYLLHVFQAKAAKGKLLASGLELLSNHPESAWLLDQFLAYVQSARFLPTGRLDVAVWERLQALARSLNGWSRTTRSFRRVSYASFLGELYMSVARQTGSEKFVAWETQPVPKKLDGSGSHTFRWVAGLGWVSQPAGKFSLLLGDKPLVNFQVAQKDTVWKSADGRVRLAYRCQAVNDLDSSGIMELTVPASLLTPGKRAELRVVPAQTGSRRWFGLYEYP